MVDVNNPAVLMAVRMALKVLNVNISADDLLKNYDGFQRYIMQFVKAADARITAVEQQQAIQNEKLDRIINLLTEKEIENV